ncbi:MAG: DUF4412 domain-containing protein [Acidobacteria bacterium]|nr:DUF4412 domain-containing protein [Acidobacteriota bacterium]MCA1609518.1 DUF4412 domain-containing protein [Acidobacteriota bacterium]
MRVSIARRLFVCAGWLIALSISGQDLTVQSKFTMGNSESPMTQYVTSEYGRSSSAQADTIVHFPTGRMTMIDHKKRQYWEATVDDMAAYWEKLTRSMRGTPLEDMFGGRTDPKLEKLPGKQKFAGYDCERWSLSIGDVLEMDLWAAPGLQPPPRYYDSRKLAATAMGPMGQLFQRVYEELRKVKGFPLSTAIIIRTPMSRTQTLEEATEVRKGPIPASTFQVPDGYKKVNSPFVK